MPRRSFQSPCKEFHRGPGPSRPARAATDRRSTGARGRLRGTGSGVTWPPARRGGMRWKPAGIRGPSSSQRTSRQSGRRRRRTHRDVAPARGDGLRGSGAGDEGPEPRLRSGHPTEAPIDRIRPRPDPGRFRHVPSDRRGEAGLARDEHERWLKTKPAARWSYGESRNDEKGEHDAMVRWERGDAGPTPGSRWSFSREERGKIGPGPLPQAQREIDRQLMADLGRILASAGFAVAKPQASS
jgi:hypothetical protein